MAWRIGVDSGGTFTDICLFDEETGGSRSGRFPRRPTIRRAASPTASPRASRGVGAHAGAGRLFRPRHDGGDQRADPASRRDDRAYHHRRLSRPPGDRPPEAARPLRHPGRQAAGRWSPRDLRLEVPERVRHDGAIDTPLDEAAVRAAARTLRAAGVQAVAVCFLYGFVARRTRKRAARILRGGIARRLRLRLARDRARVPRIRAAVDRGGERLSRAGHGALYPPPRRAAGGAGHDRDAASHAVQRRRHRLRRGRAACRCARCCRARRPAWSAPRRSARLAGFADLITFDMGGTSTDVALMQDGEAGSPARPTVHGYPIKAPMLDIHTVGAGGGSIACIDNGGLLKVGPRSAGADPGPACYDRGNDGTDRHRRQCRAADPEPEHLLGGRMPIRQASRAPRSRAWRASLGIDMLAAAQGILSVVTANMARRSASSRCSAATTRATTR